MVDLLTFLIIVFFAFIYELGDAAIGQGYGTLGTPTFILLGFDLGIIVPSILISQAVGGLIGAYFHHRFKNADFGTVNTADMKKVYVIIIAGIIGVIIASILGSSFISKEIMMAYIGVVVIAMGVLILSGIHLRFSWKKFCVIGAISAFNKGMSGGGYGPVVTGGQVLIGIGTKNSIGITDFSEGPICIAGFITWVVMHGFPDFSFMVALCIGAAIAPAIGAWLTSKARVDKLKKLMGLIILILGLLTLFKILNP